MPKNPLREELIEKNIAENFVKDIINLSLKKNVNLNTCLFCLEDVETYIMCCDNQGCNGKVCYNCIEEMEEWYCGKKEKPCMYCQKPIKKKEVKFNIDIVSRENSEQIKKSFFCKYFCCFC